ncbi:MAG: hypothetical protein ACQERC_05705 [Bacteroidota bacterium]
MRSILFQHPKGAVINVLPEYRGEVPLDTCGMKVENPCSHDGMLRLIFDFGQFDFNVLSNVVFLELHYDRAAEDVQWHCEFNGEPIVDEIREGQRSSRLLFHRETFLKHAHHHNNILTVYGEFNQLVVVNRSKSKLLFSV